METIAPYAIFKNDDVNYSLANEDNVLELSVIKAENKKKLCLITGSGVRSIFMLSSSPETMTCCDLSPTQNELAKTRLKCLRSLSHESYLSMWGYNSSSLHARKILSGKWERSINVVAGLFQFFMRTRIRELFSLNQVSDQQVWVKKNFSSLRWKSVLFLVANRHFFNALMYKGNYVKKSVGETYFSYFNDAFKRVLSTTLARDNFFLHLIFYGEIRNSQAMTLESDPVNFQAAKDSASKTRIKFVSDDIVEHIASKNRVYDFVSLSDAPSYFADSKESNYLQTMKPGLIPGAVVVVRNFLKDPSQIKMDDYIDISADYREIIAQEKTQMYRIKIYRFTGVEN